MQDKKRLEIQNHIFETMTSRYIDGMKTATHVMIKYMETNKWNLRLKPQHNYVIIFETGNEYLKYVTPKFYTESTLPKQLFTSYWQRKK